MAMQDASDVFHKKQMYNSVITGKENASKDWNCIISMFLIVLITICLKTAICFFFGEDRLAILQHTRILRASFRIRKCGAWVYFFGLRPNFL